MIKVALTGGIGSGKTTVANYFMELGVPVYFADIEAKRLMQSSKVIKRKLIAEFGNKAYVNNELNRPYLAAIVFNDKQKLAAINKIVHPSVSISFKRWLGKQNSVYAIQENAILFESNSAGSFDYILTVTAPLNTRISRVIERDQTRKNEVLARINNQMPDSTKVELSHFVIDNIDLKQTKNQVQKIHQELLKIAQESKNHKS
tara:strand:- start:79194 stop:79802 length:609 start_codon:yes stop_codon:yes gene_type:complete